MTWAYVVKVFAPHVIAHQRLSTVEGAATLTEEHNQPSIILRFQPPQCLRVNLEAIEDAIELPKG